MLLHERKRSGIKDAPPKNFVSNAMANIGNHSKVSTADWEALTRTLEKLDTHYNKNDELFECGVKHTGHIDLCSSEIKAILFGVTSK